jgi:hypothetical protein
MDKSSATPTGRRFLSASWPTILSVAALIISAVTAALVILDIGGQPSHRKYDFSSPEAALRSDLTMTRDGDFDAIRAFYRDFNRAVASEALNTLHIERTREYKGAKMLFLSFTERGEPVKECRFYVRDAESGLWGEDRKMRMRIRDAEVNNAIYQWEHE